MTADRVAAGVYVRISQDRTGEGLGVARQEEDCRALAEQHGWEVAEVYRDNDKSASSGKARPAYRKMLADLDAGRIGAIIAWHPDRLYRRAVDLGDLVDVCKRNAVQVATVNAGDVDLTTPTGRLVAGLLAQVATYEVEHKTERWQRSYRQAREAGRFATFGQRLYGYTVDGQLVDDEVEVARSMAADVLAGKSLSTICERLDRAGVRTAAGGPWQQTVLGRYLQNPRIAGFSTARGVVVGPGQWEPVLDADTWETVGAVLASRSTNQGPRPARVALLLGLALCGRCETRLVTTGHVRGRRYRCPNRPGLRGCGGPSAPAEKLEEFVEGWAQARLDDPRVVERAADLRRVDGVGGLLADIGSYEKRLVELDAELSRPDATHVNRLTRALDRVTEDLERARDALAEATARSWSSETDRGGQPWPVDLGDRRRLVAAALAGQRVFLDPATRRGPGFDSDRIRFDREQRTDKPADARAR